MPEREAIAPPEDAGANAPVVTEFGDFTYVAKLVENRKVKSKNAGKDGLHRTEWYQVFERQDERWPDNNPVKRYNQATLAWGDGTPVRKGSDADIIASAFKDACGMTLLPDEPSSASMAGVSYWKMRDVETAFSVNRAKGDPEAKHFYLRIPVEFLGIEGEYKYEGQVRTLQQRGDGATPASEPASDPAADDAIAKKIAAHLVGLPTKMENHEWAGPIGQDESLREVNQVFGENFRGALTAGTFVTLLIDKGYLRDNDGVLQEGVGG